MRTRLLLVAGLGLLGSYLSALSLPAQAGQATGTLSMTAQVIGTCSVQDASIAFTYNPDALSDAVNSTPLNIYCTTGMPGATVGIGAGLHGDGRTMTDANGHPLSYQLFMGNGGPTWTTSNAMTLDPSTSGTTPETTTGAPVVISAKIPRNQAVPPGTYTDQLPIVVNF